MQIRFADSRPTGDFALVLPAAGNLRPGLDGHHAMLINRMRHGDMINQGQTLYTLEVHPAAYAGIAANEAEKAAEVHLLEVVTFGAVGRLWLGGYEAEIGEAARAIRETLASIGGRENRG